ncbi:hypothetical protein Taro_005975, partial [Colocasia esculenta]|nr:hypothetical protein [Colocasia esculenta]
RTYNSSKGVRVSRSDDTDLDGTTQVPGQSPELTAWLTENLGHPTGEGPNTSLQRLNHVEKMIVRVLELAGTVMDELAGPSGPRKDAIAGHCHEFMKSIRVLLPTSFPASILLFFSFPSSFSDIQVNLREEIKGACEYRPFEKCDYNSRIANEICCKKLEYVIEQLDVMQQNLDLCKDPIG